jgi:hypothetical protein
MTQAAGSHVAIKKIDVAHKRGVEERSLIHGRLSAPDQCASTRRSEFRELLSERLEGPASQSGDRAAKAVQNIAF